MKPPPLTDKVAQLGFRAGNGKIRKSSHIYFIVVMSRPSIPDGPIGRRCYGSIKVCIARVGRYITNLQNPVYKVAIGIMSGIVSIIDNNLAC